MIVSNRRHYFGLSHFGVVKGPTFGCAVCTAPEGLFKGCSTVFLAFEGDEWNAEKSNRQLVPKAMLNPSFSKEQRAGVHNNFLEHLDKCGNNGFDLAGAIDEVLATARNMGVVIDFINKAHALVSYDLNPSQAIDSRAKAIASKNELDGRKSAEGLRASGIAYHDKCDFDRAIGDFDEAIRLDPNDAKAYANRGIAYGHQEKQEPREIWK
jgi:tetratricopeptide (TPR) repeat protein